MRSASSVVVSERHVLQCARNISFGSDENVTSITLSPFDQIVSASVPTSIVFIYRRSYHAEEIISTIVLLRALQLLLDYYPQLTGRLHAKSDGSYEVTHLGTGFELLIAESSKHLQEFSSHGVLSTQKLSIFGNELLPPFDTSEEAIEKNPVFMIQHTSFACGSVALGVRLNHVVSDAEGLFQVMKSLAELYRGFKKVEGDSDPMSTGKSVKLVKEPPQSRYMSESYQMGPQERDAALTFEPSLLHVVKDTKVQADIESLEATVDTPEVTTASLNKPVISPSQEVEPSVPKVNGRVLRFSSEALASLKTGAADPSDKDGWVSTFEALAAFMFQRIYLARKSYYNRDATALSHPDFLFPVNFRGPKRLPDLPTPYFGNALLCLYTTLPHETLVNGTLRQVAKRIHNLTQNAIPDANHVQQTLRWISAQPNKRAIQSGFRYGNASLMISQWASFDMLTGMDFEVGVAPALVLPPFTPIICFDGLGYFLPAFVQAMESNERCTTTDGIDVYMSLLEPIGDILVGDEEVRRFASM